MAVELIATPGAEDANSYLTVEEADAYFESRIKGESWSNASADEKAAALITATRVLDSMSVGQRRLIRPSNKDPFYLTSRTWTGTIATDTQALAWPRIGMRDRHGRSIASDTIPKELKQATAELAGQLYLTDRTLDNEAVVQGISSISAGSVSISFKDAIEAKVLPDLVLSLLPPSWFTDEIYETYSSVVFEVL